MEWLKMIVLAYVVGLIARAITPGRGPKGIILTTLLGFAGAFLATYTAQKMGWANPAAAAANAGAVVENKMQWVTSWMGSVLGSMVLLGVWHVVSGLLQKSKTSGV